jgi:CubicO group peptidase (beta-lactamase class C family)
VPGSPRVLPDRPSLRYLKLEAKRRVATGELSTLHAAQLAIAQEHGLRNWTALKRLITDQQTECHPLSHLRWLISRFADADRPRWTAPDEAELREHFTERFLRDIPPAEVVATAAAHAADLRGRLTVAAAAPLTVAAEIAGLRVMATAEPDPPHRLTELHRFPLGSRITDARAAAPATKTAGAVPGYAAAIVDGAVTSLGLPGLVTAGQRGPAGEPWAIARGWADLEAGAALSPGHRFPAAALTTLITMTAVLRIVADGGPGLDDPAGRYLRAVRLADDEVSIRELLAHTGGVDTPREVFAASVPRLETLCGPVLACGADRGSFRFSLGGYAALGEIVAEVTRLPYAEAARRLVLEPLGMRSSSFPRTPSERGGGDGSAVTSYGVTDDGSLRPEPPVVCTLPAAGGLWTTAADLVRFGRGWSSLLPAALAREALSPQASRESLGGHAGLGWLLTADGAVAGCAGGSPGAAASLLVRLGDQAVQVTLANRWMPVESVSAAALSARPAAEDQ